MIPTDNTKQSYTKLWCFQYDPESSDLFVTPALPSLLQVVLNPAL